VANVANPHSPIQCGVEASSAIFGGGGAWELGSLGTWLGLGWVVPEPVSRAVGSEASSNHQRANAQHERGSQALAPLKAGVEDLRSGQVRLLTGLPFLLPGLSFEAKASENSDVALQTQSWNRQGV